MKGLQLNKYCHKCGALLTEKEELASKYFALKDFNYSTNGEPLIVILLECPNTKWYSTGHTSVIIGSNY